MLCPTAMVISARARDRSSSEKTSSSINSCSAPVLAPTGDAARAEGQVPANSARHGKPDACRHSSSVNSLRHAVVHVVTDATQVGVLTAAVRPPPLCHPGRVVVSPRRWFAHRLCHVHASTRPARVVRQCRVVSRRRHPPREQACRSTPRTMTASASNRRRSGEQRVAVAHDNFDSLSKCRLERRAPP